MRGRREEGRYFEFFRLQGIEEKVEDGHDRLRRGMKESSMDLLSKSPELERISNNEMKLVLFIIHAVYYSETGFLESRAFLLSTHTGTVPRFEETLLFNKCQFVYVKNELEEKKWIGWSRVSDLRVVALLDGLCDKRVLILLQLWVVVDRREGKIRLLHKNCSSSKPSNSIIKDVEDDRSDIEDCGNVDDDPSKISDSHSIYGLQ
ncbi:hypothetical protein Tco_0797670 [Tanacetum coccineum]